MTEKDLNRTLVSSVEALGGWSWKIPDPSLAEIRNGTGQRPFDSFGYSNNFFFTFEAKFLRGYQAFNFGMIKSHQFENLSKIKSITASFSEKSGIPFYTPIVLGIWESRKFFDIFFFDIQYIIDLRDAGNTSIKKKELEALKSQNKYLELKKDFIDLNKIPEVIIYADKHPSD
jgi:hypothetical protein